MNNNAAERACYAGNIFDYGMIGKKEQVLQMLPKRVQKAVEENYIYIHDLEGYGEVYNCCCPETENWFIKRDLKSSTEQGKIFEIFQLYQELIAEMALNQTGGIGFANFDQEVSDLLEKNEIKLNKNNERCLEDALSIFFDWLNVARTRYNREPYYVTLNIGLSRSKWGRKVSDKLLNIFAKEDYIRPNIVFKVNKQINSRKNTPNHNLFLSALRCTAEKMIPTYLLTDSRVNCGCSAEKLAIMGCRSRVYKNRNGCATSIGRGNIAYVTINLPKIALISEKTEDFYKNLDEVLSVAVLILLHRKDCFLHNNIDYMKTVFENKLWGSVTNKEQMIRQGTFSVGFIGLEETAEILFHGKRYESETVKESAENIIRYLSKKVERYSEKEKLNFTLLATSGENVSGFFCKKDKSYFCSACMDKEFYTNSFHVDVGAGISPFKKIDLEAPYHLLCTGGAITYIEFKEAVIENTLALLDLIEYAEEAGISYIGFNYPMDICKVCGKKGTFDICPKCGASDIIRIRRVSGYLEKLDFFTEGKKAEVRSRKNNL